MTFFRMRKFVSELRTTGRKEIWYFFFLLALVAETIFSPISNYKLSSFVIKGIVTFFLFTTIIVMYRKNIISFGTLNSEFSSTLIQLNIFLIFCAVTLLYSSNRYFGSLKWFNFILSFYPLLIGYYLFFISFSRKRGLIFLGIVTLIILTSVPVIVFSHPFAYDGIYTLSLTKWSHVIYGRFIGSVSLLFLLLYLSKIFVFSWKTVIPFFAFIFLLNLLTGLRASILAIIIIVFALTVYALVKKNYLYGGTIFFSLFLSLTFFYIFPGLNQEAENRTENLIVYSMGDDVADGPIKARESLYKTSVNIIKDNWITGVGFGGFKNISFGYDAYLIEYAHNMFLEFWVELGLMGVVVIFLFLYKLFRGTLKISPLLGIAALYPFILSMFSKDIPGQTLFALSLALISLPEMRRTEIKKLFSNGSNN